jgi:tetratricopeptide (TPR) repeat protein
VQLERFEEGLADLERLPADSLEALTWLGKAYQGVGRAPDAKASFRKGLALEPRNRWLRLYLANQLAGERAFDEAEALYRGIVADDPYFPLAFYNYGRMLMARGEPGRARPLLERAVRLAPQHEGAKAALRELPGGAGG